MLAKSEAFMQYCCTIVRINKGEMDIELLQV